MNILLVQHIGFLNGQGGTEKICSFLANGFAANGHLVTIATLQKTKGKPIYALHKNVQVNNIHNEDIVQYEQKSLYTYIGKNPLLWLKYKIKKKRAKAYNRNLFRKLGGRDEYYIFNLKQRSQAWQKYIKDLAPNLIITMSIGSLLEITYQHKFNIPIINSTNGRPDYDYTDTLWHRSKIEMKFLQNSFQHLSATQVLFESYKNFLPNTFKGKSVVIPNPVPMVENAQLVDHSFKKDRYKIIHIGSLVVSCKQQDIAIEIFSHLALQYNNWDLFFWGTGADLQLLKNKIESTHLKDRIFLMGFTDTPLEKLKNADIFIFPSKYEGFPLALTEAMSVGLPSLGFKNCSGVNELIKHDQNGFLANDKAEMAQYLEQLICEQETRSRLGTCANTDMHVFKPERVFEQWNNLIRDITI